MITPANFNIFVTTVNTMIGEAYADTAEEVLDQIAMTIPMSTNILELGWTGMLPQMRLWTGPRVSREPNPQTYVTNAQPFEFTLQLDRFRLDDDQFGIYYRMLPDMARQAKRWPVYQIRNLLEGAAPWAGTFQNGLDGLSNWNTAHLINLYQKSLGTYCNDFTGGGQTINGILVGGTFSPVSFATLYEYMRTLKGEDNEILGVKATKLMHPAQLATEVLTTLKSTFFAPPQWGTMTGQVGSADNTFRRFGVEPIENDFLSSATKWYLMDASRPGAMPFGWGLREAPVFVQRTNENDPIVFDEHSYVWGDWGRGCPFWSFAWLCCRSGS